MAPFRASRSTRSGRPGAPSDQDVFDGLPVRQWRLQHSYFGPNDEINGDATRGATAPFDKNEPLMPKGSEHYAPWSLQLLRAARMGKVLNTSEASAGKQATVVEKEESLEEARLEETARGVKRGSHEGFMATKWGLVPKHEEGPEQEYLAKRRKGLQAASASRTGANGTPAETIMRKTKVRRPDDDGLPQVLEVMVPEGLTVEGEIREDVTLENAAAPISNPAPGTVVPGLGVANQDGVVVATEGVVPLNKRPKPVGRKKKKKGGKTISSTGGMGVSASAEAFEAQQRRAAAGNGTADGADEGQSDSVMAETNGADDEEEGSEDEDDDEEGSEKGEIAREDQRLVVHSEETGEAQAMTVKEADAKMFSIKTEAPQVAFDDLQAQFQNEITMDTTDDTTISHGDDGFALPGHEYQPDEPLTQESITKEEPFHTMEMDSQLYAEQMIPNNMIGHPEIPASTMQQSYLKEETPIESQEATFIAPEDYPAAVALTEPVPQYTPATPARVAKVDAAADGPLNTPTRPSPEPLSPLSLSPSARQPRSQPLSAPERAAAAANVGEPGVEAINPVAEIAPAANPVDVRAAMEHTVSAEAVAVVEPLLKEHAEEPLEEASTRDAAPDGEILLSHGFSSYVPSAAPGIAMETWGVENTHAPVAEGGVNAEEALPADTNVVEADYEPVHVNDPSQHLQEQTQGEDM